MFVVAAAEWWGAWPGWGGGGGEGWLELDGHEEGEFGGVGGFKD